MVPSLLAAVGFFTVVPSLICCGSGYGPVAVGL